MTGRSDPPDTSESPQTPEAPETSPPDWFTRTVSRTGSVGPLPDHHRPVRPPQGPWRGTPAAMFPGEDSTQLIQRITDEAVPGHGTTSLPPDAVLPDAPSVTEPALVPPTAEDAARAETEGMRTATTGGVVRASALMAIATVVSRGTGLLAKIAIAAILGGTMVNSAYTLANTLPNIVFELLIGGVLTSVAIPLLTRAQRSDADGGLAYTQRLMSLAVVGLVVATGLSLLAAPLLTRLYLSGDGNVDPALATDFAYLLLPQIFFYGVAALFGAVLNTKERFAINAWAPVFNNLVVIAVALYLAFSGVSFLDGGRIDGTSLLILGIGTTAGIVVQAAVMIPSLRRSGFRWKWRLSWDPRFAEAGRLLLWATAYVLVSQVGVVAVNRLADAQDEGGVWMFATASLIFQMPYGILGVAILTAIMPRMSRHAAAGDMDAVKNDASLANRLSTVALLPVATALVVLGAALVTLLFGYGRVEVDDTILIGGVLGGMALGLVPLAITLVQMRVFFAMKDARTPTMINAIMIAVRVPLMIWLVDVAPAGTEIAALAFSTAVSYIVGAIVGEIWLRVRFGPMGTRKLLVTIGKMLLASLAGGAAAYFGTDAILGIRPESPVDSLLILLVGGAIGLLVIALLAIVLGVEELKPIRNKILRRRGGPPTPPSSPSTAPAAAGASAPPVAAAANTAATSQVAGSSRTPGRTVSREKVTPPVSTPGGGASQPPAPSGPPASRHSDEHTRTLGSGGRPVLTPTSGLSPGSTIGGRYRLVSLIGTDSAGNRFWRAKDSVLPRDMAVTLLPDNPATAATVARTLRVGRLHHIGLPQTLDVGQENGQSYVVGQWVDGATLTDLLSGGPLELEVATSITAKLAEAVAEAHRNGIALGALNPALIRVNFDGQVRLSHVIAHGNATPEQDIRGVGALFYLMLTGTWPLGGPGAEQPGLIVPADGVDLPPAKIRLGRAVPADEVRPEIPEALSTLAERAMHPEDPAGIHAVSAIGALLRQPDVAPAPAPASTDAGEPDQPVLSAAERRLVKERRIKLSVAGAMLVAFATLIIILFAGLAKNVLTAMAGEDAQVPVVPGVEQTAGGSAEAPAGSSEPAVTSESEAPPVESSPEPVPQSVPIGIAEATVYDPEGDGNKDNTGQVPRAFDSDPSSFWGTFQYRQQPKPKAEGGFKAGVGLTLELERPTVVTSVQLISDSVGSVMEIRSASGPDAPLAETRILGTGTIVDNQPLTVEVTGATESQYLIVFVTTMTPDGNQFRSVINEIRVFGTA